MGHRLHIDEAAQIVRIEMTATVDAAGIRDATHEMERRGVRHFHQLWDLTGAEVMMMMPDDFNVLASLAANRHERFGSTAGKIAAAASNDVYFAIATLGVRQAGRKGARVAAFRSVAEAQSWLLEA